MISLRPAERDDALMLLRWRNDEQTRLASLSQALVSLGEHEAWMLRVLADPQRFLYIAIDETGAVGTSRFDLDGESAEVSINLNPDYRGQGLSGEVLVNSIGRFREDLGRPIRLTASIRESNRASVRLFTAVGFEPVGSIEDVGIYSLRDL